MLEHSRGKIFVHRQLKYLGLRLDVWIRSSALLAVSLLPLLASVVKDYRTLLLPFERSETLSKEGYRLRQSIKVQEAIFSNHCQILLERKSQHDVASCMLSGTDHRLWSDTELEEQLGEILGDKHEVYIGLIKTIKGLIKDSESKVEEIVGCTGKGKSVCFDFYRSICLTR